MIFALDFRVDEPAVTTKPKLVELLSQTRDDLARYLIPQVARAPLPWCLLNLRMPPVAPLYQSGSGLAVAGVITLLERQLGLLSEVEDLTAPAAVTVDLTLVTTDLVTARRYGFQTKGRAA